VQPGGRGVERGGRGRGNRIVDDSIGIWTLGVDPASTKISHNFLEPGVTPVSSH
jgi:hypothetical protein